MRSAAVAGGAGLSSALLWRLAGGIGGASEILSGAGMSIASRGVTRVSGVSLFSTGVAIRVGL